MAERLVACALLLVRCNNKLTKSLQLANKFCSSRNVIFPVQQKRGVYLIGVVVVVMLGFD